MTNRAYDTTASQFSDTSEYNRMAFVVQQLLSRVSTCAVVRVVAVNAATGTVDISPMVHQVDGRGQPMPHGTIFDAPYIRLQAGSSAIILDPVAGDIGLAFFASHDISKVKATRAPALPGSKRRHSLSDALYVGGILNQAPTQYIKFRNGGIDIVADVVNVSGDVVANGTSLHTHKHSGVSTGGGQTGFPV